MITVEFYTQQALREGFSQAAVVPLAPAVVPLHSSSMLRYTQGRSYRCGTASGTADFRRLLVPAVPPAVPSGSTAPWR